MEDSLRPGPEPPPGRKTRLRRLFFGPPRDLRDRSTWRELSLMTFLAWVGLGADGLSSSSYGPEEAFKALGEHRYLALGLAALTAFTVLLISTAYSRILERFPRGGGGYVVATKLLGSRAGAVSGAALLVDYVLTIAISIAAAGDAIFSFLPAAWHPWKLTAQAGFILLLLGLNLRGLRESVIALTPIFLIFLLTHAILLGGGLIAHAGELPDTLRGAAGGFREGWDVLGPVGLLLLFLKAYSLGGGTYTGIEAVSNGLAILREPRVRTGKRTMALNAVSLALTAAGLLLCYLLWNVRPVPGKTMNAALLEAFTRDVPLGPVFVVVTLLSEGALLLVAAQAGFVAGPRVLANMAVDSWVPRRFAALSERLTTQNGLILLGLAALAALLYTKGDVGQLVVMYSINVFLTFSLSMLGMLRDSRRRRDRRGIALFGAGFALCGTILLVTAVEKFALGGWLTLAVTGGLVGLCFLVRSHYRGVRDKLDLLYRQLGEAPVLEGGLPSSDPDPGRPVAAVLVANYGGLGLHTFLTLFRHFPRHFQGVLFLSVGVIDSREYKGEETVDTLRADVEDYLRKYVAYARSQGVPADFRLAVGTDAVEEGEKLCLDVARDFPQAVFFAGKVIFEPERWFQRLLHNETASALERRLHAAGRLFIVVPAKVS